MAKKSTVRIRKIKLASDAEKIIMTYERLVNDQWDEYNFTSSEEAAPGFYDAFKAMAKHAAALCEYTQDDIKNVTVSGISLRYSGEEEVMGATMTVKKELKFSNTPLVTNTPFKKSGPDSGGDFDEKQYLSEECVKALWELERQARLYIAGHRAQISLFGEDAQGTTMDTSETPQEGADEAFDDEVTENIGNVVNFPAAATGGGLETHVSL